MPDTLLKIRPKLNDIADLILDATHDAIVIIDASCRIVHFNRAAENIFQYQSNEIVDFPMERLIPGRFHSGHNAFIAEFEKAPEASRLMSDRAGVTGRKKNGDEFSAEISITKIPFEGRFLFAAVIRDQTELNAANRALSQATVSLDLRNRILEYANRNSPTDKFLKYIVKEICLFYGWSAGQVFEINDAGMFAATNIYFSEDEANHFLLLAKIRAASAGNNPASIEYLFSKHDPYWSNNLAKLYHIDGSEFDRLNINSVISFKIGDVESCMYVLEFYNYGDIEPTDEVLGTIDSIKLDLVNILSKRAMESQVLREMEKAEAANRAKTALFASMNHELRTPLNAIIGFSEFLIYESNDRLSEKQSEYLRIVVDAGQHLHSLIGNILEMSSIELKPEGIKLRPEYIVEHLQASLEFINPLAAERNIKIEFEIGRHECWQVLADATRLKQVFINILANAVKYNNLGGAIMIRCIKMPDQRIRVAIKDTGTGISPSNLGNIFEPFDRAGRENSSIEGTGLGLALSKKIVETMNGAIGVESVPDIGSEFWVEFDEYTG